MSEMARISTEVTELPTTWSGEMRALLALGIPMAAAQLAQYSIYTIDTIMIGRIGPEDLAAAALGTVIYFLLWMIFSGPVMCVSPLVSQALGADKNDTRDARRSVRMAIWLIFMMSPVIIGAMFFTEVLSIKFGQDPIVAAKAQSYVLALAFGLPFALATMALRNFLAAIGKTMIPLFLAITATAINALLNYGFIFGAMGFPRLELVGAGIASSISYCLGFFLFVAYIAIDKRAKTFHIFERFFVPDWTRMKEVISLGWPISLTTVFEGSLFNAAVLIVGVIGVMQQAAYNIALNIVALAFMLPWGISMAGAVRIGLAEGAGNVPAKKRAATTTLTAALFGMGLIAICVSLFPTEIAGFYLTLEKADNRDVIGFVISFLPIAGAFMIFDAAQVACNQLLRGLKDVRWPMIFTGISYWVIGFPIAFYLGLYTEIGARGVWYGLMAGLLTASIFLGIRLAQQLGQDQVQKNRPQSAPQ